MALASEQCSASRRAGIAGATGASLFCSSSDACWRCAGVNAFSSDFALVSLPALCCLRTQATRDLAVTSSPPLQNPHPEYRPLMPVLPVPLCRISISTSTSSRTTAHRPVFMPVATVASALPRTQADGNKRISTLLIIYPLFNRRSSASLTRSCCCFW